MSPNPVQGTETQVTDKIRNMATINPNQPPEPPIVPPRRESGGAVVLERRTERVKPPSMYQVLMLNDDYTPMEFVVVVIQEFFSKDLAAATQIMLKIHLDGRGVCGVTQKTSLRPRLIRCWKRPTRLGTRSSASVSPWIYRLLCHTAAQAYKTVYS